MIEAPRKTRDFEAVIQSGEPSAPVTPMHVAYSNAAVTKLSSVLLRRFLNYPQLRRVDETESRGFLPPSHQLVDLGMTHPDRFSISADVFDKWDEEAKGARIFDVDTDVDEDRCLAQETLECGEVGRQIDAVDVLDLTTPQAGSNCAVVVDDDDTVSCHPNVRLQSCRSEPQGFDEGWQRVFRMDQVRSAMGEENGSCEQPRQ